MAQPRANCQKKFGRQIMQTEFGVGVSIPSFSTFLVPEGVGCHIWM